MPKQSQRAEVSSFIKGLVTEATALNFPANASADEENYVLNHDGSRQRRLGMGYEAGHSLYSTGLPLASINTNTISTFNWEAVGGDPNLNYLVTQYNNSIALFDLNKETTSSTAPVAFFLNQFASNVKFSFASVEGYLVVAAGDPKIAVLSYTPASGFKLDYFRLLTRDLWGIEETENVNYEIDPTYRNGDPSWVHNYNLCNQSWGTPRNDDQGNQTDPATYYRNHLGLWPSNSEQVWPALQQQAVAPNQPPFERLFSNLFSDVFGASTKSAKGYFIIDALNRGASRLEQFNNNKAKLPAITLPVTIPNDVTYGGATCIADFAGRIFYSGFFGGLAAGDARSPNLANYVFFSQTITNRQSFPKCYQAGDPTSRDTADLVDTDGGFVRVSGAESILALVNIQTALIVIATNGIWSIQGGDVDSGFSATNYKVSKISTFGAISLTSVVAAGANCFYWAVDGIYSVGKNQYGDLEVKSITTETIQTFYKNIPSLSKKNAFGAFDTVSKTLRWIYKDGTDYSSTSSTIELVYDVFINAFYKHRIIDEATHSAAIWGMFKPLNYNITATDNFVYAGTDLVQANADNIVVSQAAYSSQTQTLKYLFGVIDNGLFKLSVGYYNNTEFLDWQDINGIGSDAKAFLLTGTEIAGDSGTNKQVPYLILHFNRTESGIDANGITLTPSGCLFRCQWNFANTIASNRWTELREGYRYTRPYIPATLPASYDTGFSVITTKNKIRGYGRGFSLYFETEPGKDCHILGWNLTANINSIT